MPGEEINLLDSEQIQDLRKHLEEHKSLKMAQVDIIDAITKKHAQNTDTSLGIQAADLNMNQNRVKDLPAPAADYDAARRKYVDDKILPPSASDDMLISSADVERNHNNETYTKVKEIKVGKTGTYRIKWQMKVIFADRAGMSKVYKNGSSFGAEKVTYVTTYNNYSESSLSFSAGDLIQLYIKVGPDTGGGGEQINIKNFKIHATNFDILNVLTD